MAQSSPQRETGRGRENSDLVARLSFLALVPSTLIELVRSTSESVSCLAAVAFPWES
jgi:hypothetical protein